MQNYFLKIRPFILMTTYLLTSCSVNKKTDENIKELEKNLSLSNALISQFTYDVLSSLENKSEDWSTRENAKIWYDKAKEVTKLTKKLNFKIDSIKKSGLSTTSLNETLRNSLIKYKTDILSIDKSVGTEFATNFDEINYKSSHSIFSFLPVIQNQINRIENNIVRYCYNKCCIPNDLYWYSSYSLFLEQNSRYLKPGDLLEIKTGIGIYSRAARPKIDVNGFMIELGDDGAAHYKIKVPDKPGIYKIPINVSFFNQTTGHDETKSINAEYVVLKPCDQ